MVRKRGKVLLGTALTAVMCMAQPLSAVGAQQSSSGKAGVGVTIEKYTQIHEKEIAQKAKTRAAKTTSVPVTTDKQTASSATKTEATAKTAATTAARKVNTEATAAKAKETEPEYSGYRGWAAPAVRSVLNVRKKPSSGSEVVGKLKKGSIAKVVKKGSQWTEIQSGTVKGYVKNDYLVWDKDIYQYAKNHDFPTKAIVTAQALKVRQKASVDAKVLTLVSEDDSCRIISEGKDWVKVKVDGASGYLSKDYIKVKYYFTRAVPTQEKQKKTVRTETTQRATSKSTEATEAEHASSSPENAQSSDIRTKIVNYALSFVGNKYVYGGESLTNGVDCSGFTMKVYQKFGYALSHGSSAQAGEGRTISISSVRPGDLLFYKRGGRINHVTMYIGNGKVVHASNSAPYPQGGIKVSSIGYRTPCKAVRIIR